MSVYISGKKYTNELLKPSISYQYRVRLVWYYYCIIMQNLTAVWYWYCIAYKKPVLLTMDRGDRHLKVKGDRQFVTQGGRGQTSGIKRWRAFDSETEGWNDGRNDERKEGRTDGHTEEDIEVVPTKKIIIHGFENHIFDSLNCFTIYGQNFMHF